MSYKSFKNACYFLQKGMTILVMKVLILRRFCLDHVRLFACQIPMVCCLKDFSKLIY
jgi:hypothetical protein